MADISDIPYIQGPNEPERSNPVILINKGNWTNASGTITTGGQAQQLFPAQADDVFTEFARFVTNVNQGDMLWVNWFGEDAAPNAPGSMPLPPYSTLEIPTGASCSIYGDVTGAAFTAGVA